MQTIDALICPRWTLRVEPEVIAEEGLALAIDGGRIVAVLPVAEADRRYRPRVRHERPKHVLLPGLVNAAYPCADGLFRGFADDLPSSAAREHIWPRRRAGSGRSSSPTGPASRSPRCWLGGSPASPTCTSSPTSSGSRDVGARHARGARHDRARLPDGVCEATPTSICARARDSRPLQSRAVGHDARSRPTRRTRVGDATLTHVRRLADELDAPVHITCMKRPPRSRGVAATGRGLSRGSRHWPRDAESHRRTREALTAEDRALASAGASVVHCPRSNLKLASGPCPVAELLRAGVNVALGTDGAASNNRLDLWAEMELAALLGNRSRQRCSSPRGAGAAMATINGARAFGLGNEIGSLVAGKAADVICVGLVGSRASSFARSRVAAGLRCFPTRRDRRLDRRRAARRGPGAVAARRCGRLRRRRALGTAAARVRTHDGEC